MFEKHSPVRGIFCAKGIALAGVIAALYVVLTLVSSAFGLSSGVIQIRISEALCILPCFTPAAIPGLFIGCLLSNIITGAVVWDVVFGSIATLIGALGTYLLRKNRWLAIISPIAANAVIVPLVLVYAYHVETAYILIVLTVLAGEVISAGVLGELLYTALGKHKRIFI